MLDASPARRAALRLIILAMLLGFYYRAGHMSALLFVIRTRGATLQPITSTPSFTLRAASRQDIASI